jgi:hypothetical protein
MKTFPLTALITTASVTLAFADHGPGTSGSGAFTESAETLKPRQWSATVRADWTEFKTPSDSELADKDSFELIDRAFLTTLNLAVGVTENFQFGLVFGYYAADGTREIEHEHEHEEAAADAHEEAAEEQHSTSKPAFTTYDPDGWTDLWLNAKVRLYRGPAGQFALYGGVKFPVGDDRVINSAGERVEPAATAGTGAWDGMFGAAYTVSLMPDLALDASAQYTLRGEQHHYRLGHRLDAGLALGWRIIGEARSFPQVSLQAEANVRSVAKSKASGERDPDTGGTVLFLSPGVRVRFSEHAAWTLGVQLPTVQHLNGDQVETDFRVTSSVNLTF